MSVLPSDIVVYGSANMPEADGAINGGPVDFSRRVAFYDIAPAGNLVRCFQNNAPMGSCCIVDFVAPGVDYWLAIDVADEGDQAFLEFVFGADADMTQHRTRQLGEEALDEIEP
jgi:hypothetical protein